MEKFTKYLTLTVLTAVGGWLPTLLGASELGGWSIFGAFVGGIAAVWIIYKLDT